MKSEGNCGVAVRIQTNSTLLATDSRKKKTHGWSIADLMVQGPVTVELSNVDYIFI